MTELEMFAKLPQLNENCEKTNIGYIPTLSLVGNTSNQYIVFWFDISTPDLLELHFIANTPEEAIRKAYEWCKSNNLL